MKKITNLENENQNSKKENDALKTAGAIQNKQEISNNDEKIKKLNETISELKNELGTYSKIVFKKKNCT